MGGRDLGFGTLMTILLATALTATALPVPVAVLLDEDTFATDTVTAGEWIFQSTGGHYQVAGSQLRLSTDAPVDGIKLAQVAKIAVHGPLGSVLEATTTPVQHGLYEIAMWTPVGSVNLAATDGLFRLYSTDLQGVVDSEVVPLSWPVGTTVTLRLALYLEGHAEAQVLNALGGVLGAARVDELWLPLGLELTIGAQAWTAPGLPAADYLTDVVKLAPMLP